MKIAARFPKAFFEGFLRLPVWDFPGTRNVGLPLPRFVHGQRTKFDLGARASEPHHEFRQFTHAEFVGVAQIDRTRDIVRRSHEAYETVDEIADVAERTGLVSIPVDGNGLAL